MKTLFAHHKNRLKTNVAGHGFNHLPRRWRAIPQTSQAILNRAPARWRLSLWRALVALLTKFQRVCAAILNRRTELPALSQSNY